MQFTPEELNIIDEVMNSQEHIDMSILNGLIEKTERLVHHEALYRGVSKREGRKLDTLIVGDSFVVERPMSFTPLQSTAEDFATDVYATGKIIAIKPTKPCMNYYEHAIDRVVSKEYDNPTTRLSLYAMLADERECIYKTGTTMILDEIEEVYACNGDLIEIYKFSLI